MDMREDRWPSAWQMNIETASGPVRVRVRNISASGLRFTGPRPPRIGEKVRFQSMGDWVQARVVRREADGGALQFRYPISSAQIYTMRQYRDLL